MSTNVLGVILAKAWARTGDQKKPGWGWVCHCIVCVDLRRHMREPEGRSVPEAVWSGR